MNFPLGVIIIVGVLAAIILGLIASSPDDIIQPRIVSDEEMEIKSEPTTVSEPEPEEDLTVCTMQWDPMCGVDGETYGNLCMLDAADVKLDYQGECVVAEPEPVEETPATFADHSEVTIGTVEESGFGQDCATGDGCYTPVTATVDVGGKVIMTNTDTTGVHTFTSGTVDGFTPSPSGTFDSDVLLSGDSFEWVPDTAGEVPYYCMLHTWMQGTIIVQEKESMEEESMEEESMEEVEETPESSMALTISIPQGVGVPGCETTLECYLPYEVSVAVGATVTWINDDTTVHTVTSGKKMIHDELFDSSIFMSGDTFEITFNDAGTFDYFCLVHPWMTGIVNVG